MTLSTSVAERTSRRPEGSILLFVSIEQSTAPDSSIAAHNPKKKSELSKSISSLGNGSESAKMSTEPTPITVRSLFYLASLTTASAQSDNAQISGSSRIRQELQFQALLWLSRTQTATTSTRARRTIRATLDSCQICLSAHPPCRVDFFVGC